MEPIQAKISWLFVVASALMLLACDEDDGGSGGTTAPEPTARVIDDAVLRDTAASAEEIEETRSVIVVISDEARIGDVDPSLTGGIDLDERRVGEEGELEVDINADGDVESVYIFIDTTNDLTFLAWEDEHCHVAWSLEASSWEVFTECGGASAEGLIACSQTEEASECTRCVEGECESCDLTGTSVYCAEPEPEPDPVPDMGSEDVVEHDESPSEDLVPTEDIPHSVDLPSTEDVSGNFGECSQSCMSQSLAECCMECGCSAEIRCEPVCPGDYRWDCELTCCFNIELGCLEM